MRLDSGFLNPELARDRENRGSSWRPFRAGPHVGRDAAWLVLFLAACGPTAAPNPFDIEPKAFVRRVGALTLPLRTCGENLCPLQVDLQSGQVRMAGTPSVLLGTLRLGDVRPEIMPNGRICVVADVPVDFPAGIYDLTVEAPDGARGTLREALQVERIAALAIESASVLWPGAEIKIKVSLKDEAGRPVTALRLGLDPSAFEKAIHFDQGALTGRFGEVTATAEGISILYRLPRRAEEGRLIFREVLSGDQLTAELPLSTRKLVRDANLVLTKEPEGAVVAGQPVTAVAGQPVTLKAILVGKDGSQIPFADSADVNVSLESGTGTWNQSPQPDGSLQILYRTASSVETARIQVVEALGYGAAPVEVEITTQPGGAAALYVEPESCTVAAGTEKLIRAFLLDSFGNSLDPDVEAIAFELSGLGTLSEKSKDGRAVEVTYTAPTVPASATVKVSARVGPAKDVPITVSSGPVARFDFSDLNLVEAGVPFSVRITALDAFGNRAATFTDSVRVRSLPEGLVALESVPFVGGTVDLGGLVVFAAQREVVLVAEGPGETAGASEPFEVRSAPVDHLTLAPAPIRDIVAGGRLELTVTARDRFENPAGSYDGPVQIAYSRGRSFEPLVECRHFEAGVCKVVISITEAIPHCLLRAYDEGGRHVESDEFAVLPAAPTALVFSTPEQNLKPDEISAEMGIEVRDQNGNRSPVLGATIVRLATTSPQGGFAPTEAGPFSSPLEVVVQAGTDRAVFRYRDPVKGYFALSAEAFPLVSALQHIRISSPGEPSRLAIVEAPTDIRVGLPGGPIEVEVRDVVGVPQLPEGPLDAYLLTSSATCMFAATADGPFNGSFTQFSLSPATPRGAFFLREADLVGTIYLGVSAQGLCGHIVPIQSHGGEAVALFFDAVGDQQAGRTFQIRLTARDDALRVADRYAGEVAIAIGGSQVGVCGPFVQGICATEVTLTKAGLDWILTANDALGLSGTSAPFDVEPGPVASLALTSIASPQTAGVPFPLSLAAFDTWGNPADNFYGRVRIDALGVVPTLSDRFIAGQLTQTLYAVMAWKGLVIRVLSEDGQFLGVTEPFDVEPGGLDHFHVAVPPAAIAGQPFEVALVAHDALENQAHFVGTVHLRDETQKLSPEESGPFSDGARVEVVVIDDPIPSDRIEAFDDEGHRGLSAVFRVNEVQPPRLEAAIRLEPEAVFEGEVYAATLTVWNSGGALARDVAPAVLGAVPGEVTCQRSGAASVAIEPGASAAFEWRCTADLGSAGVQVHSVQAAGISALDDTPVSTSPSEASLAVTASDCRWNPVRAEAGATQTIDCRSGGVLGGDPAASGGVGPYTYAWTPAGPLSDAAAPNPQLTARENADFRLEVLDALGCLALDEVRIEVLGAPQAVLQESFRRGCDRDWLFFETAQSPNLSTWDFGDGSQPVSGAVVRKQYVNPGWYSITLTVSDNDSFAACVGRARAIVAIGRPNAPSGLVGLSPWPLEVEAGAPTFVQVTSAVIEDCRGTPVGRNQRFHALVTRGRILTADADPSPGLQVLTNADSKIMLALEPDRVGGEARLLVASASTTMEARGVLTLSVTGSVSLPRLVSFGPSGLLRVPPPRIWLRFDKPMDEAGLRNALEVREPTGLVAGTWSFAQDARVAVFAPARLLDPTRIYQVRVLASAADQFGKRLDVDLDGEPDGPEEWVAFPLGAVDEGVPPTLSCSRGSAPVSPDGDGVAEVAEIAVLALDPSGISQIQAQIFSPSGLPVRWLARAFALLNRVDVPLVWDGRDEAGALVPNGRYSFAVEAVDRFGNRSPACTGAITIASILDPAGSL